MGIINILDRRFSVLLDDQTIVARVKQLADELNDDLHDENPVFIAVLNGSFMFAADLLKYIHFPCQIQFIKVSSYTGIQSSGSVQSVIGLNQSISGRNIIILEDIIDSGITIDYLINELVQQKPASIKICTLLLKPKALKVALNPDYVGFEVENNFLVGYGLDYNGYGRNFKNIYVEENGSPLQDLT
ncbi:MAG: hypoxanthine phosphoribosyltransferase [Bacteroidota bacterium]|nr:hypoxanthine phosphoribosyltransferase [Bacteroidota bacterium]